MRVIAHIAASVFLCLTLSGLGQDAFVENMGQWPGGVDYRIEIPGGAFFAEGNAFTYHLVDPEVAKFFHPSDIDIEPPELLKAHAFRTYFIGAGHVTPEGSDELSALYNYVLGDDPDHWGFGARAFERVIYPGIYDQIDLKLYSKGASLKYDFVVHPGGDASQISWLYEGLDEVILDNGNMRLVTSIGDVTELEPYAYQFVDGQIIDVECAFVSKGNSYTFQVGEFDPNYKLVIDPEVSFSTYIGSSASNFGFTATDDSQGNLIAGAAVFAVGYPTTTGAVQDNFNTASSSYCDAAISKFNEDGTDLIYSTYLGGDGLEMPHSIIADSQDNWIVMGTTGSPNFPTTGGVFQETIVGGPFFDFSSFFIPSVHALGCDFFVSKFNADGSGLVASTFVGEFGTDGLNTADQLFYNYGDSFRGEVIVDGDDNIIVASNTTSDVFPVTADAPQGFFGGGASDAVLFKLDPNLEQMLWATYFGGSGDDSGYSVQVDEDGKLVMTGGTKSDNLPATVGSDDDFYNGGADGFIVKYNAAGNNIEECTYVGTSEYDQCYFVQIDENNDIYVIGQSQGDMGVEGDVYNNPNSGQFIRKYESDLSDVIWSTTIGTGSGEIDISPTAFLVSNCDLIYFSGWGGLTNSLNSSAFASTTTGLPISADAYQSTTDGSDFYLCVLSPDAQDLEYATFFGGDISREHVDGGTSKFDKNGSVYQAVCAGCGGNDDFPYTSGAWSDDNGSTNCNLGVFKFDLGSVQAAIDIDGPTTVCEGETAQFINNSVGGTGYLWDFGDGNTSDEFEPDHDYDEFGEFTVVLYVEDASGCLNADSASITIEIIEGVDASIEPVGPVCEGETVQLNASGSENLYWLFDPTLSATDIPNPIASPVESTTYYAVDSNECGTDTASVFVEYIAFSTTISDDQTICIGQSVDLEATGGSIYDWEPATYLSNPGISDPVCTPAETITYTVTISTPEGCEQEETVTIQVDQNAPGGEVYPDENICIGESVQLEAQGGFMWNWIPSSGLDDPTAQDPNASPSDTTTYSVEITNACGSGVDQVTVNVIIPYAVAGYDGQVCLGQWHPVWAEGGESYWWSPPQHAHQPDSQITVVSPPESMVMTVYVTDEYGCVASDEVYVEVLPLPLSDAGPSAAIDWLETEYLFGYVEGIDFWWEPNINIECIDCLGPEIWPDEDTWYYLYTEDQYGCIGVDSVLVEVYHPIYVPNTFTPDNDGINDYFKAYGHNIRDFEMEIRDRWGTVVFYSDDIDKVWDGSFQGGEHYVQIDTYVWTVWYEAIEGRQKLVGHVNVVR